MSDLNFFELEIAYFRSLINLFFQNEGNDQNRIEVMQMNFDDLLKRKTLISNNILLHQNEISLLLDKAHDDKKMYFNIIQSRLESEIFDFIKRFRSVKKDFFEATKHVHAAIEKAVEV